MNAIDPGQRRRTLIVLALGVAAALCLPVLGWMAVDALRSSTEGRNALAGVLPLQTLPPTPTAMLAGLDDEGHVASLAILALAAPRADGVTAGGTVILLPAGADTTSSDGTPHTRVADAYREGGIDELSSAVGGLLGITVSTAAAMHTDELAPLFAGVGGVEVQFDSPVIGDVHGKAEQIFAAGPEVLDGRGIATMLTTATATESETTRLPRLDAMWRAVAAAIGHGVATPTAPPSSLVGGAGEGDAAGMAAFVARVLAGPLQVHTLEYAPTAATDNPRHLDLLTVNAGDAAVVFATVAPSSVSPANPTLSVYVRSPLGDPALTRAAVEALVFAGANVTLVTESSQVPAPATTTVAYSNPNNERVARTLGSSLGSIVVVPADLRIGGIDVIITLGESYRQQGGDGTVHTTPVPRDTTDVPTSPVGSTNG